VSRNPFYGGNVVVVVGTLCTPQASKPFFKNLAVFLSIRRYPVLFLPDGMNMGPLGSFTSKKL